MAEIDTVRARLAELKRQGKTESTSKEAGKLSKRLGELKSTGATTTSPHGS